MLSEENIVLKNEIVRLREKLAETIKSNPKRAAKKVAKIAIDSYDAIKDLIPEAERAAIIKVALKDKLIKWSIPQVLIFVGYLLTLLLA